MTAKWDYPNSSRTGEMPRRNEGLRCGCWTTHANWRPQIIWHLGNGKQGVDDAGNGAQCAVAGTLSLTFSHPVRLREKLYTWGWLKTSGWAAAVLSIERTVVSSSSFSRWPRAHKLELRKPRSSSSSSSRSSRRKQRKRRKEQGARSQEPGARRKSKEKGERSQRERERRVASPAASGSSEEWNSRRGVQGVGVRVRLRQRLPHKVEIRNALRSGSDVDAGSDSDRDADRGRGSGRGTRVRRPSKRQTNRQILLRRHDESLLVGSNVRNTLGARR